MARTKKSRLALASKITRVDESYRGYETRYLLDFEPNLGNSKIVILWTASGKDLTKTELRRLILGFAQQRSVMKNTSGILDIQIGHRNHIRPEMLKDGPSLLDRIFDTPVADVGEN